MMIYASKMADIDVKAYHFDVLVDIGRLHIVSFLRKWIKL